jgi:hypothetical protein
MFSARFIPFSTRFSRDLLNVGPRFIVAIADLSARRAPLANNEVEQPKAIGMPLL